MNPKKYLFISLLFLLSPFANRAFSQVDTSFHIYLAFGQSNMEGNAKIQDQDKTVDPRFKVIEAVNCSNLGRTKGNWYSAIPPLCRCYSGLTPADYFGRTMVTSLPSNIKIGIVMVAIGGCKIELFDKNNYQTYVSSITEEWLKNIIKEYDGNPYAYLVSLAKLAQQNGVIKGILLHQGESNTGDNQWTSKVKGIYYNLISDLALNPNSVPLLAGEVVNADQGGVCASMNSIIAKLPDTIPNAHVISSKGCTDTTDNLHFNAAGYRELGKRYAQKMLKLVYNIPGSTTSENRVATIPMEIYPNPSINGTFTIKGIEKNTQIELINLTGKKIAEFNNLNQQSIDIHVKPKPEIYVVKFTNKQQSVYKKVVVK